MKQKLQQNINLLCALLYFLLSPLSIYTNINTVIEKERWRDEERKRERNKEKSRCILLFIDSYICSMFMHIHRMFSAIVRCQQFVRIFVYFLYIYYVRYVQCGFRYSAYHNRIHCVAACFNIYFVDLYSTRFHVCPETNVDTELGSWKASTFV